MAKSGRPRQLPKERIEERREEKRRGEKRRDSYGERNLPSKSHLADLQCDKDVIVLFNWTTAKDLQVCSLDRGRSRTNDTKAVALFFTLETSPYVIVRGKRG